jgi:Xaa-Pro aminopeptidase
MRRERIDGWLIYDFRGTNTVFGQLITGKRFTTRRLFLFVPSAGEPTLFVHGIDASQFHDVKLRKEVYLTWRDLSAWLGRTLSGAGRVAMEYAPGNTLPVVSIVDAGTVELVRSVGVDVVSSANLIQISIATWSQAAQKNHAIACDQVNRIKDAAFALITERLSGGGKVGEWDVAEFVRSRFADEKLEYPDGPIVAVNSHAGDPHYEPTSENTPINRGDWVLIDLWARVPGDENIFSDITWVGFVGNRVPEKHQKVFDTVRKARDASVELAQKAWGENSPVQGWQLDDAARDVIVRAGFGDFVRHRTGHSLSPGPKVHGMGMNLDNLETHDTREMLPGIGFTVEPGIYLPDFGVRLEIDLFVDPQKGPVVTTEIQKEPVRMATGG